MTDLPFGLSSYSRAGGRLAPIRLLNLLPETAPTSPGSGMVLLARPGLAPLHSLADVRGIYREDGVFGGALFSVAGGNLYKTTTIVGTVAGTDRAEFAYTVDGLFVLAGGIVYQTTNGTTRSATSFPDSALVASICQLNNILFAVRADTGTIYFRLPGDTVWAALDYFSAEREPDPAICVRSLGDVLWVFGTSSVEPFAMTGDTGTPAQRIDGASISRGLKDRDSVVELDNTLFFTGENNIVYRLGDGAPARVSDHGIEERIAASTTVKAWTFSWAGHDLLVLGLDTETLVYDAASGKWPQFTHDGGAFPSVGFYDGETIYAGGAKIWTLEDRSNDDSAEMERLFTYVIASDQPVTCNAIEVRLSPGVSAVDAEQAVIQHRFSDDQGRTFSDWVSVGTGASGEYRTRVQIRRLGLVDGPGRIGEVRITDDVEMRFSGVVMNPPLGGRSR